MFETASPHEAAKPRGVLVLAAGNGVLAAAFTLAILRGLTNDAGLVAIVLFPIPCLLAASAWGLWHGKDHARILMLTFSWLVGPLAFLSLLASTYFAFICWLDRGYMWDAFMFLGVMIAAASFVCVVLAVASSICLNRSHIRDYFERSK